MKINTVTVLGANGTVGTNVSGIFASFGNAKVYMVSRSIEKSTRAAQKAAQSVRADAILGNLIPADYSMLNECIANSDLVFECVSENLDIKQKIWQDVAALNINSAIYCSGTSGLSIRKLAEIFTEENSKQFFGVHFFNPPYSMSLCELIKTDYSDEKVFNELEEYLSKVLFRTVVEVKDSPAFLGNRIGFQFINEALQYSEKYKYSGGIDYIDAILGPFSGRNMPPLVTSDFVGLDVHKAIVENVYENSNDYAHETFKLPLFADELILEGHLGRKTKGGLYEIIREGNSSKKILVYDIITKSYRDKIEFTFPFIENMVNWFYVGDYAKAFSSLISNLSIEAEICVECLLKYLLYSLFTADQVSYGIHSADDVMVTGFNWCPPLGVYEAMSEITDVEKLIYERIDDSITNQIDIQKLFAKIEPSKYDYRRFFKAIR
ncbi:MAG: 3-hydroxyacyl-CoA dehydrogenase family protein [Clostridiales bacterium]